MAPELSIVVVNWNTRALLLRLLGRLFPDGEPAGAAGAADARLPFEVLVVDNASTDGSADAARAAFPAARVLPQPRNGGFAYGVNRGIEASRGRWILLLNTDADVRLEDLRAFVAEADAHPEGLVFGPRIVDEHGRLQPSTWRAHLPRHALTDALFLGRLRRERAPTDGGAIAVDCVSGCVFLVRREALRAVGGLDERFFMYFEEADLCERVRRSGGRVLWLPRHAFVHEGGLSAEQAAVRTFLAFRESRLLYHAAWHGRAATELVRACLWLASALRLLLHVPLLPFGRRRRARARLHWEALKMLSRPSLAAELCRRPRSVLAVG